jgi:hypothetical protein
MAPNATIDDLREALGDDDKVHESTLASRNGFHVVLNSEESIGSLFKFARESGLETDLFRPSPEDKTDGVLRGWLDR